MPSAKANGPVDAKMIVSNGKMTVSIPATKAKLRALAAAALAALLASCASPVTRTSGNVQSGALTASLSGFRTQAGYGAVAPDATLGQAALQQAQWMAATGRMDHTTGRGRDFVSRMNGLGIEAAAENIAHAAELDKVFAMWKASPPHRRNMLDPRFGRFGLASAPDQNGKRYWALVLGR